MLQQLVSSVGLGDAEARSLGTDADSMGTAVTSGVVIRAPESSAILDAESGFSCERAL